jgi:hypothetical protein
MSRKPNRASGYAAAHVDHVRATCLYVATKLGDLVDDTVIIGGLVPSLLVDQSKLGASGTLLRSSSPAFTWPSSIASEYVSRARRSSGRPQAARCGLRDLALTSS